VGSDGVRDLFGILAATVIQIGGEVTLPADVLMYPMSVHIEPNEDGSYTLRAQRLTPETPPWNSTN
jgi:hypothetical protein